MLTENYADARAALDKLGDQVDRGLIRDYGLTYSFDAARAYALTGNVRQRVEKVEKLIKEPDAEKPEDWQAAIELLASAAKDNSDAAAKPYFDCTKTRLAWLRQFARGDWVELTFEPSLLLWNVRRGSWDVKDEHGVVGSGKEAGKGCQLDCIVPFKAPFEVECNVECLDPGSSAPNSGIAVGKLRLTDPVSSKVDPGGGCLFWVSGDRSAAGYTTTFEQRGQFALTLPPTKHYHLRTCAWDHAFEFYVNDTMCVLPNKEGRKFSSAGLIALADMPSARSTGDVLYSHPRIRKLAFGPPPELQDYKANIEYYTQSLRNHPNNGFAHYSRGLAYLHTDHWDEAIADLEKARQLREELAGAAYPLGVIYQKKGDYARARKLYEQAVAAQPDKIEAHNALAWLLATCPDEKVRNGAAAVKSAQRACEMTHYKAIELLDTLAAAYAEAGNFDKAVHWQQKSLDAASDDQKTEFDQRLKLYQAKKPYHQPPKTEAKPK